MSKKIPLIIALALAAVLLFTSCTLSESNPPQATPTVQNPNASPQPTGISLVEAWGTSTAIYLQTAQAQGLITATYTETPGPTAIGSTASTATQVPPTGAAIVPIIVVPTATPGRPATYTLQKGDFPWCIARRFNVNQNELLDLNGIGPNQADSLPVGYTLRIPQTGNPFVGTRALHPHPVQYTVVVDDTFNRIACYFGDIDPTSIAAANGLSLTSPLTTGRILNIP